MMNEYVCIPDSCDESCLQYPCKIKVTPGAAKPIYCPYDIEQKCQWGDVIENKQSFGNTCLKFVFIPINEDKKMNKHTIGYEQRNGQNLVNRINKRICKMNEYIRKLNRLQHGINKDMQDLRKLWGYND